MYSEFIRNIVFIFILTARGIELQNSEEKSDYCAAAIHACPASTVQYAYVRAGGASPGR